MWVFGCRPKSRVFTESGSFDQGMEKKMEATISFKLLWFENGLRPTEPSTASQGNGNRGWNPPYHVGCRISGNTL